jgi:cyclohexanecarboxylate-CoA ligase
VRCRLDNVVDDVGELLVRGPERFVGYLDPALNADSFTTDGFFRTGDLAKLDDGAIVICGRSKDVIIRGGENISVKEVEDLLYEHESITDVAVVAMPDPRLGEKACAFVVLSPGAALDLAGLREYLDGRHIARQKYPERLEIVDALPRTATGKVQKFMLRERLTDQKEHPDATSS